MIQKVMENRSEEQPSFQWLPLYVAQNAGETTAGNTWHYRGGPLGMLQPSPERKATQGGAGGAFSVGGLYAAAGRGTGQRGTMGAPSTALQDTTLPPSSPNSAETFLPFYCLFFFGIWD